MCTYPYQPNPNPAPITQQILTNQKQSAASPIMHTRQLHCASLGKGVEGTGEQDHSELRLLTTAYSKLLGSLVADMDARRVI